MKILHYAIENFARIPANLVDAEKELGHESYLVVPYKPTTYFADEDYCLNLPLVGKRYFNRIKKILGYKRISASNKRKHNQIHKDYWRPESFFIKMFFNFRDKLWEKQVRNFLAKINIDTFDVLVLDGGAGFLRNGKIVRELKKKGLKIIVTYCGSDFRSRGPIRAIEEAADYRLSFEHDHTLVDPSLDLYFAPFAMPEYDLKEKSTAKIRIGHAPTNRLAKGTDKILTILSSLKSKFNIEIVLIEKLSHGEALSLKSSCDLFIDNIGEIGYGINSLESLSMGIPTAVQLLPDLEERLGEHPFINISAETMEQKLIPFIESDELRKKYALSGKQWVDRYHNPTTIAKKILTQIDVKD